VVQLHSESEQRALHIDRGRCWKVGVKQHVSMVTVVWDGAQYGPPAPEA